MVDPCDEDTKKRLKGKSNVLVTPGGDVSCLSPDTSTSDDKVIVKRTVKPIPDELHEPPPEGVQFPPPLSQPGPMTIYSRPVEVFCEDPESEGEPVSYPAGKLKQKLYFSLVLSLTEDVLDYIAKQGLEDEVEAILNAGGEGAEKDIHDLTGMRLKQAKELLEAAREIQDNLTSAVEALARSQLVCCWWNDPQTAECEDPEMVHEWEHPDAVFSATVPGHTFQSCYSKEAANQQALMMAQSMLRCFYLSDPFVAKCEERPDRPLPEMEPVPNDEFEIYPGRGLRVGTVEVPAGMFTSALSKEDANRKAQEWGYSQLVCWYPNDPIHAECTDPNARDLGLDPAVTEAHGADLTTERAGQWVDVPLGYFTSELAKEYATEQAQQLADMLLQCCFINRPIHMECEPEEVLLSTGETVTVQPEPYPISPVPEINVEAGKFTSCTSQEEADAFAQASISGMLDCRYCSGMVLPTCVPDWVIDAVLRGEIELPLQDGMIRDENHPNLPFSSLPVNATRGANPCMISGPDAQEAQRMADVLAGLPATSSSSGGSGEKCTYFSDKVVVACAAYDPESGMTGSCGGVGSWLTNAEGESYYFYSMYPADTCLYDAACTPAPGTVIILEAGMFTGKGEEVKPSLNSRAVEYAMSLLFCPMTNPPAEAACFRLDGASYDRTDLCADKWYYARSEVDPDTPPGGDLTIPEEGQPPSVTEDQMDRSSMLMEWSSTSDRPASVGGGLVLLTGYCPEEAASIIFEQLKEMLGSQIRCDFGNYRVVGGQCSNPRTYVPAKRSLPSHRCGSDVSGTLVEKYEMWNGNRMVVEEKTFIGETAAEATTIAMKLANMAVFCYNDMWQELELINIPIVPDWWYPGWNWPSPTLPALPSIPPSSSVRPPFIPGPNGPGGGGYSSSAPNKPGPGPGPGGGGYSSSAPNKPGPGPGGGGYSSSAPASTPPMSTPPCTDACYYCCPAYKKIMMELSSNPSAHFTSTNPEELLRTANNDISMWENDVAYSYETFYAELTALEKELKELTARINEG